MDRSRSESDNNKTEESRKPASNATVCPLLIRLTAEEQIALWEALNEPPILTPAKEKLGALMRGEV